MWDTSCNTAISPVLVARSLISDDNTDCDCYTMLARAQVWRRPVLTVGLPTSNWLVLLPHLTTSFPYRGSGAAVWRPTQHGIMHISVQSQYSLQCWLNKDWLTQAQSYINKYPCRKYLTWQRYANGGGGVTCWGQDIKTNSQNFSVNQLRCLRPSQVFIFTAHSVETSKVCHCVISNGSWESPTALSSFF